MTARRLLILSLLAVSGAAVSATAASVYAAGNPARRRPPGTHVAGRTDPLTPALLVEAADSTQSNSDRAHLLDVIMRGACFSTREMLFGASFRRHAALDRAIDAMTGMPESAALRRQSHQQLDRFTAGAAIPTTASSAMDASDIDMLRWLLPRVIEARVDYCRARQ